MEMVELREQTDSLALAFVARTRSELGFEVEPLTRFFRE
jgi:hypothetical protein